MGNGISSNDALEKSNRVNAVAARKQPRTRYAGAIVYGDVVVQAWPNLANVHVLGTAETICEVSGAKCRTGGRQGRHSERARTIESSRGAAAERL
jgi:hypothetical protein